MPFQLPATGAASYFNVIHQYNVIFRLQFSVIYVETLDVACPYYNDHLYSSGVAKFFVRGNWDRPLVGFQGNG
jgi:hypothetical protein